MVPLSRPEDFLVAAHARHEIAGEAGQLVAFIEEDVDVFLLALAATRLQAVEVVPNDWCGTYPESAGCP